MAYKGTETVKKEYAPIGRNRVRLLEGADGLKLDIREHVTAAKPGAYEGFTPKGVRLDGEGMLSLYRTLGEIFAPPPAVRPAPVAAAPARQQPQRPAPAPQRSPAAPAAPSIVKVRAAQLSAVAVQQGPKSSPAVDALKERMRRGETVPLSEIMAASAAPAAAPVKAAPAPAPEDVRALLDKPAAPGVRVGDLMISDIMEETVKKFSHV